MGFKVGQKVIYPNHGIGTIEQLWKVRGPGIASGERGEAEKTFHFMETTFLLPVYRWQCRTRIAMPIRCEAWGTIPPDRAVPR